jgi:NitT/TauT family transport system substrate-binding protein
MARPKRLAAIIAAAACLLAPGAAAQAQELPLIRIAASTNDSTTPAIYAIKAGLFKNAGLNVELTAMNSGAAVASAVAGSAIQIGNSSLLNLIEAHVKHVPFTLVGTSAMIDPSVLYGALVVKKDSPIRTGRDLNGKTIAVPALQDFDWVSARAWIDQNGGDSSTVRFIELSSAASLQAVVDGRIDTTILAVPTLTQGMDTGSLRVLGNAFEAIAKRYIYIGWFTTQDYATKNRDVVERFSRVMHDAAVYCNAHHAETADLIVQFAKLDPKIAAHMQRVTFAENLTPSLIQPLIDVAAKYKAIDKGFDASELINSNSR